MSAANASAVAAEAHRDAVLRDVYVPLAEIPTITAASFVDGGRAVQLTLSARDHAANAWTKTTAEIGLVESGGGVTAASANAGLSAVAVPATDDTVKASWTSSKAGLPLKVVLREGTVAASALKDGGGKRRCIEVWRGHRCQHRIDVTKKHGAFATDDTFRTLDVWEPPTPASSGIGIDSQPRILYAAEANLEAWLDEDDSLAQYDYRPALGEKLQSRVRPTLFLLDLGTQAVSELTLKGKEGALPARSVLSVGGDAVYATVLSLTGDGRRLGQVYCTNRPSEIHELPCPALQADGRDGEAGDWSISLDEHTLRSQSHVSAASPYAVANGVVYLAFKRGGPHSGSCAVVRVSGKTIKELVPIQQGPLKDLSSSPLFAQAFPTSASLQLGKRTYLAITSIRQSRRTIALIDIDNGRLIYPNGPPEASSLCRPRLEVGVKSDHASANADWSYSVLNTDSSNRILAVRSRPATPHELVIGSLEVSEDEAKHSVTWSVVWSAAQAYFESEHELHRRLQAVQSGVVDIEQAAKGVQAIVVRPPCDGSTSSKDDKPPLILFPHGGPHSASTIDWSPSVAALALLGYTVALPNYSGSLGVSQDFVESLIGRCGELDISDCFATVEQLIAQGVASRDKLFVTGGSHGGFITAHMIGFPNVPGSSSAATSKPYFRAAAMRNPVIAAGQQAITSDIPDWCFAEFGEPYDFARPPPAPHADVYGRLEDASPIRHMDKIETPVLLLVGLRDLRVPYWSQGKVLYHSLRERGKKVRMLTFKDADHALDTLEAEAVSFLSTVRWFREALP